MKYSIFVSIVSEYWLAFERVPMIVKFQKEEVSALDFKSMDEIRQMIISGVFHAYEDEYLKEVFKI